MAKRKRSTALITQPYDGFAEGMNVARPAHEISDQQARYLQDIVLDRFGLTRRRGPVNRALASDGATPIARFTRPACGIVQAQDPSGTLHVGVLEGNGSAGYLSVYSSDYSSVTSLPWPHALGSSPYYIVDTHPTITGGALIGTSKQYDAVDPSQALALWRGGSKLDYSAGSVSFNRNSTAVTGSGTEWLSKASAGMFLFAFGKQLIGCIKSIESDTALTLELPALNTGAGVQYSMSSLRGLNPRAMKGRITASTADSTVTGENTKFLDEGMSSGTWDLFRSRDMHYIGTVSSVTNNTALTLTASSALSLDKELYTGVLRTGDYGLSTTDSTRNVGFLTAIYAQRHFYANHAITGETSRLWYSDISDLEGIDLSAIDGDFIDITSGTPHSLNTPIKSIASAFNSLLILKETETFALFGTTPEQFEVRKLNDDGVLSGMSVQQYNGGILYAGRQGIYHYDGIEAKNITANNLGDYYRQSIRHIDPSLSRMWGMVDRDHYVLFIESVTPPVKVVKGFEAFEPDRIAIVINLVSNAVTLWTNVNLRGAIHLPPETGLGTWFVVNDINGGVICNSTLLWEDDANDTVTCIGDTAGPDFFLETKKFGMGDGTIKKMWKQILVHFQSATDGLRVDTVPGLNEVGAAASSELPESQYTWDTFSLVYDTWDDVDGADGIVSWSDLLNSVYVVKRVKFLRRDQYMSFRVYQNSNQNTQVNLGPFAIGFKWMRPGRT